MTATPEQRAETIAGLREALDFLENHPELPVYRNWTLSVHTTTDDDAAGRAEVDAAAQVLGVTPTGTAHYRALRQFGAVGYEVLHIESAAMREHRAKQSYSPNIRLEQGEGETP